MEVIWSDEAVEDYHQNIDYLLENWSVKVALEFTEDVEAIIQLIKARPELYPLSDYKEIRRAVVRRQITLFFKVKDETISLIRFWNNHRDIEKLEL